MRRFYDFGFGTVHAPRRAKVQRRAGTPSLIVKRDIPARLGPGEQQEAETR